MFSAQISYQKIVSNGGLCEKIKLLYYTFCRADAISVMTSFHTYQMKTRPLQILQQRYVYKSVWTLDKNATITERDFHGWSSKSAMWWLHCESGTDVLLFIRRADEQRLAVQVASFHFPQVFGDNEQCLQLQPDLPSNTRAISFYTSVKVSQSVFHRLRLPRAAWLGAIKFQIPRPTLELF